MHASTSKFQFKCACETISILILHFQMKQFLKKCKIANYTKQIKQIIEKVEETSKVIMQRRKTVSLSLNDNSAVVWFCTCD